MNSLFIDANGGSVGDGHGRYNGDPVFGNSSAGDLNVGDYFQLETSHWCLSKKKKIYNVYYYIFSL